MKKQIKSNFISKFYVIGIKIIKSIKLFILSIYLKLNGIRVKDNILINIEKEKLDKNRFIYYITFRNKFYNYKFFKFNTLRDVKQFINKLNNAISLKEVFEILNDLELGIDEKYIKEELYRFEKLFGISIVDIELIDRYFTLIGTNTRHIKFKDILTDIKQFINFEYIVIDL